MMMQCFGSPLPTAASPNTHVPGAPPPPTHTHGTPRHAAWWHELILAPCSPDKHQLSDMPPTNRGYCMSVY